MQYVKQTASKFGTVLAIVLPESRQYSIEALLDKYAQINWRDGSSIYLIVVDDRHVNSPVHVRAAVKKQCREFGLSGKATNIRYLLLDDFREPVSRGMNWIKSQDFFNTYSYKNLADDRFEIRLKEWGLDWRACALAEVKKWQHDEITDAHVENWLSQFDKLGKGNFRWVGELLLKNFRVWSEQEILDPFEKYFETTQFSGQSCIIRYENGKSGDSLAVMLRKKLFHLLDGTEILEYREVLENGKSISCDLFEDGVFTGVEIGDLFKSLLGMPGYEKCAPLTEKKKILHITTNLHFSLGTDIGVHRVFEVIKELELPIQLHCGNIISVLTDAGLKNLQSGALYRKDEDGKNVLRDSDADIIPQAFNNVGWGSRRKQAIEFCKKIGFQLFASYQKKRGKYWSESRLGDCSLGAGNMAFLFAFTHSLPKSTLPFFWCHGNTLNQMGKAFTWIPLFPSAHQN